MKKSKGGVSVLTVLFLIFLVLKLCSVIDWSWWWVTAPLWGGWAVFVVVFLAVVAIGVVADRTGRSRRA